MLVGNTLNNYFFQFILVTEHWFSSEWQFVSLRTAFSLLPCSKCNQWSWTGGFEEISWLKIPSAGRKTHSALLSLPPSAAWGVDRRWGWELQHRDKDGIEKEIWRRLEWQLWLCHFSLGCLSPDFIFAGEKRNRAVHSGPLVTYSCTKS